MKNKTKKIIFYTSWLLRFSSLTLFFLLISIPMRFVKRYKNLWLISERPDEARDNGYWLFKWIVENEPTTNVKYVLSRKSKDYDKMPRKDLIIEPNSAEHYISYILSSFSISTHMHGACPGKSFCIPFLPFMRKKKTVFLQHGITKDCIKLRGKLDAIIASAQKEKNLIAKSNPQYKHNIYVTGLCRYDNLTDLSGSEKEKIILIMPTFRKWLRDIGRLKNANSIFKQTEYYKAWDHFLNSEELQKISNKTNTKIIFFPHKEMQELAHNFKTRNKNIKIGKPGEFDIQDLLKRSSVLITDYSSVFFDFVYMNKPVIFYQFDQNEFHTKHYAYSGEPYPFGRTALTETELLNELSKLFSRDLEIEGTFKKDAESFYKFRDQNNCKRNYSIIKRLK